MCRIVMAGLLAVALIAVFDQDAKAGSVSVNDSHQLKAEVVVARIRLYEHEMHLRASIPRPLTTNSLFLGRCSRTNKATTLF